MTVSTKKVTPVTKNSETVKKTTEDNKAAKVKTVEKETTGKKTVARKTSAKKTTAVKKTVEKKEIEISTFVQYYGKQVEEKEIIARVKDAWITSGRKEKEIEKIILYIKPEENRAYYVINETETGSVEF